MFNTRFNDRFQNTGSPYDTNNQYYAPAQQNPLLQTMAPPPAGNPLLQGMSNYPVQAYAKGGIASKRKKAGAQNSLPILAEKIRQKGVNGDTVLAHINPLEARMLGQMSGNGSINPKTGLPQFNFLSDLGKAIASPFNMIARAVLPESIRKPAGHFTKDYLLPVGASMLVPGLGPLGKVGAAAAFGGARSGLEGKSIMSGALKGGMAGAMAPTVSGWLGSGANALGATGIGSTLTNYGNTNAIFPALESAFGLSSGAAAGAMSSKGTAALLAAGALGGGRGNGAPQIPQYSGVAAGDDDEDNDKKKDKDKPELSFMDTLMGNTKSYLSDPKNLLTAAVVGSSLMNRPKAPKEKTPEQLGDEAKRRQRALMLTPKELAEQEAYDLELEKARRRNARRKFLPEERFALDPIYRKNHTPEEYSNTGRWMTYYNNPEFSGNALPFKQGGYASYPDTQYRKESINPLHELMFFQGHTGGQDDLIPTRIPEGSYIVDASTVANLGDGNTNAGAQKLINAFVSDGEVQIPPHAVTRLGKGDNDLGAKKLDKMVKNVRKHKGGSIKLPPKAKPIKNYIRG